MAAARLTYLRSTPVELEHELEAQRDVAVSPVINAISDDSEVTWFRVDYTSSGSQQVLHTDCHLHLSAFPRARIPMAGLPSPKQFVEFVMATCYPEAYNEHRLNEHGAFRDENQIDNLNETRFECGSDPNRVFLRVAHIRMPGFGMD